MESARAACVTRRVEDLNGRRRARITRRGGEPFKPQTVLLRLAEASAGAEAYLAMARHLVVGVVLGGPGFVLGERGRRDASASTGRKSFLPKR
jgi:hypothetical protein